MVLTSGAGNTPAGGSADKAQPSAAAPCSANIKFVTNDEAQTQLSCLAADYAAQRDKLMVQSGLAFDLPLIAGGTALVANPIYHGAAAATSALGLSSALLVGGKTYVGATVRIQTLHAASQALQCAATVAGNMSSVQAQLNDLTGLNLVFNKQGAGVSVPVRMVQDLIDKIRGDLVMAAGAGSGADVSSNDATNLQMTIADAESASTALRSAKLTEDTAPEKLGAWAKAQIISASDRQFNGVQNVNAVLQAIKNAGPSQAPNGTTPIANPQRGRLAQYTESTAIAVSSLKDDIDAANFVVGLVNSSWTLQSCPSV